ncbi:MAG: DUF2306 domain-containing protein [Thermaurantiacus sp.]
MTTPILAIALHATSAVAAVPLGAVLLWSTKGTTMHRSLGRVWIGLMLVAAISSAFLTRGFSPLHLLSAFVLLMLPVAIAKARRGDVAGHRRAMRGMFIGLCLAGAAALLPFRYLGAMLWG